jgi:uncharacterized radical SAM superfamily Fe-S cluster-containing enzyme
MQTGRPASLTTKKVCPSMATVVPAAKKPDLRGSVQIGSNCSEEPAIFDVQHENTQVTTTT